jgi:NAD+ diphosphatase
MPVWQPKVLDTSVPGGWVVVHSKQQFLCDSNGVLFPREWLKKQELPVIAEHGIGYFDNDAIYLLEVDECIDLPGFTWQGLRRYLLESDSSTYKMLGYASQIGVWAREHRFCGSCGIAMQQIPSERAMFCGRCDVRHYPRISPSMIVLITRGDDILLARSPRYVPGMYSTLAGFVEPGESAEDCVRREVYEEVGLEVRSLRYMGSQCWPFPHSMMLGFHAEYAGGDIRCAQFAATACLPFDCPLLDRQLRGRAFGVTRASVARLA